MTNDIDYTAEYDNSGRVENSDDLVSQYILDSALYRETSQEPDPPLLDADIVYGAAPRNQLDLFWPETGRDCPIVMFIHGGYWQRLDRTAFSHMASGLNARGIAVAIPSYTLCPDASIADIINEMRRACVLLHKTHDRKLVVIGHSAGGHLAACMLATDWHALSNQLPDDLVTAGVGLSGIYQLAPLIHTPINIALKLDESAAQESSPYFWMPDGLQQFDAWVGEEESSEFHRQSRELAEQWSMLGTPTRYVSRPGANHFTIIEDLADPSSTLVDRIVALVEEPLSQDRALPIDEEAVAEQAQDLRALASSDDGDEDNETKEDETTSGEEAKGDDNIAGLEDQPA